MLVTRQTPCGCIHIPSFYFSWTVWWVSRARLSFFCAFYAPAHTRTCMYLHWLVYFFAFFLYHDCVLHSNLYLACSPPHRIMDVTQSTQRVSINVTPFHRNVKAQAPTGWQAGGLPEAAPRCGRGLSTHGGVSSPCRFLGSLDSILLVYGSILERGRGSRENRERNKQFRKCLI